MLTWLRPGSIPATASIHRLGRGLPGYLILFATHAFAPQRQLQPSWPPSPPVFHLISTNFTSTLGIPPTSTVLKPCSFKCTSRVKPWDFTSDLQTAYAPFTPSNSEQRSHPLYYRGCWHRVSRCFLCRYHQQYVVLARTLFSLLTGLYNPKAFITHAASLRQSFLHCAIFPTAASRRSLDRVSVPV